MDDATLKSLKDALGASPDNTALKMIVLRAFMDRGQPGEAVALLDGLGPDDLPNDDDRNAAARALIAAGGAETALDFASVETPESLMLRARALLDLGREPEGREAYARAVSMNAAVEDLSLKARLFAREAEPAGGGGDRPKLRVISNDNTDEEEVHRLTAPEAEPVTFADVGGLAAVKDQIRKKIILPFEKPALFEKFRKRIGGGILLYGPPGCGKTLLARATAGECGAQFFNVAIADVLDMYIGESEGKLHAIFEAARSHTPAVLFFDEIEALGGKRQHHREATSAKLVSQFLAEMDGFAKNNSGVLVLGATNVPWAVDPAFRRPGRFDRVQFIPPPDRPARAEILGILLRGRPLAASIDADWIAGHTSGFSGADLENIVETAADLAIEASLEAGDEVPIDDAILKRALKEVKPTTLEWLTTARNYARYANEGGQYDDVLDFLAKHGK